MRALQTIASLTMLLFAVACTDSPTEPTSMDNALMLGAVGSNPVVGTVTGSGHGPCTPTPTQCLAPGPLRTLSFNARVHADGSVSGMAQVQNRATGLKGRMTIECVNFFGAEQNRAWMVGIVTQSNMEASPPGTRVGFAVADNGEGEGADVDQVTGIGPGPDFFIAWVCDPDADPNADAQLDFFFDNVFGFDTGNGNVQVRAPQAG